MQKKKSTRLADANTEDTFENNEESRWQCDRCSGDENDCGTVMLIRMRSKRLTEQGDGSIVSSGATDGSTASAGATYGTTVSAGVTDGLLKVMEL